MHEIFRRVLELSKEAAQKNEVPIAAAIADENNKVICAFHNQTEERNSFVAHAEMLCIQEAAKILGSKYLANCKLYVSVEPCQMCLSAAKLSRIRSIHYLLASEKFGSGGRAYFNTEVSPSDEFTLEKQESLALLRSFFEKRR